MSKQPYKSYRFEWLLDGSCKSEHSNEDLSCFDYQPFPIPDELGSGGFQRIDLSLGFSIFHAKLKFHPSSAGRLTKLADVFVEFHEPTLLIQTLRKGRVIHRECELNDDVIFYPGLDEVRFVERCRFIPFLDCSSAIEIYSLAIGQSVLWQLIGEDTANALLSAFGITKKLPLKLVQVPAYFGGHLEDAIATSKRQALSKLRCQAYVLEYLNSLIEYFLSTNPESSKIVLSTGFANSIHSELISSSGKLPTLDELAEKYGRSARTLNDEFVAVYGQSIFTFAMDYRLSQAHDALKESEIPIKSIATQLGYAHVNHFSAAFKRKFGYPPGSLRKK
jgi:AraC-like DNA-binding protein